MPTMISSVFWNHFIPFLADQGLKYFTIGHVRATGHSSEKAFVRYICYDEEN